MLSLLPILWNFAFKCVYLSFSSLPLASLLFSAICKASSDNHFAFLHIFFLGIVLITGVPGSPKRGFSYPRPSLNLGLSPLSLSPPQDFAILSVLPLLYLQPLSSKWQQYFKHAQASLILNKIHSLTLNHPLVTTLKTVGKTTRPFR